MARNTEKCRKFRYSQNTVRTHVKRIYRACGVHSRQELIARCETEESQGRSDGSPAKSPSNPS